MMESVIGGEAAQGWLGPTTVFFQVVMIDLVLAGDNAVAVGLAAAGLDKENRRKVILFGLGAAVAMRIGFALITAQLLGIIGLLLAGGILLLWVCWKMWRDLRGPHTTDALDIKPSKSFRDAFLQILIADLSMSLDNVLAVAGAAREHPVILAIGLLLSIVLMGVAANAIASLLGKHRWIGFVGLLIVLYVALHMIWEGHRMVVIDVKKTADYNAVMPSFADIKPKEIQRHERH
jgi:YjbE family integral membrane protein